MSIDEITKIIRVQTVIRGFLERRKYRIKKSLHEGTGKYFTAEEAKETVGGAYQHDAEVKERDYTYKNGAIYSGQWLGGLRHGKGTMTWRDGARYEGKWQYNMAAGEGKFFHIGGDIYDGKWMGNKANGFGTYMNTKGARYEGNWKDD